MQHTYNQSILQLLRNACNYAKRELGWTKAIAGDQLFTELTGNTLQRGEIAELNVCGLDIRFSQGWKPGKRKQLTGMPIYKC